MPHKKEVVYLLKKKKKIVKITNTCNILKIDSQNNLIGDMTDIKGFKNSIKELGLEVKNKDILLVGAGGIGTSLSHYFLTEGTRKVRIHDIDKEKSQQIYNEIRKKNPKFNYKIWNYNKKKFDFIINASPVGMYNNKSPVNPKIIKNSRIVVDFVLSNKKTKLLEIAENNDIQIISGNSILIHQIPSMLKFFGFEKIPKLQMDKITNDYI